MNDVPHPETKSPLSIGGQEPKMWSQLTDSEKIERMRQVVHDLSRENSRLRDAIYKYRRHSHADNGDILVPLTESGNGYGEISAQANNANGPWF